MSRTTVTLTEEADALVRKTMRERKVSFRDAVNSAVLEAYSPAAREPFRMPVFDLGIRADVTKALDIAARLEDDEIIRKREVGK